MTQKEKALLGLPGLQGQLWVLEAWTHLICHCPSKQDECQNQGDPPHGVAKKQECKDNLTSQGTLSSKGAGPRCLRLMGGGKQVGVVVMPES